MRTRAWLPGGASVVLATVAAVAFVAFIAFVVSGEVILSRGGRMPSRMTTLSTALHGLEHHVCRLAVATSDSLLAGGEPRSPGAADGMRAEVNANLEELERVAAGGPFAPRVAEVATLARAYEALALEARSFAQAGDAVAAQRVLTDRGQPALDQFDATSSDLHAQIAAEEARLDADLLGVDRVQRYVVALAVGFAVWSVLFLSWLTFHSARLAATVREQEERLTSIIAGVPGVVWEAWGRPDTRDQRIDFVSDHVKEMLGYDQEDWLATPNFWLSIVYPEDRERAAAEAAAIYNSGKQGVSDFRWVRKDGGVIWVRAFSSVVKNEAGRAMGMRGVTTDITEEKLAEEALEAARVRFETMLHTLPHGISEIDASGRARYLNPAAERLLQRRARDLAGELMHAAVHVAPPTGTPVHPEGDCPFEEVLRAPGPIEVQDTFVRGDGSAFLADLTGAPVRAGGRVAGAVLLFQDATERLRQEQLKDDYLAFASHELRSPLTVVSAMAQFLARRVTTRPETFAPEIREAIEALSDETTRMARMVETFLDLARIESDRLTVESDDVDLAELVHDEAQAARHVAPNMSVEVEAEAPFPARTDDTRVRQVLRNLLDNAGKYGGPSPNVQISLRHEDGRARIDVRDHGPGIAPEHQARIFERLYRVGGDGETRQGLGAGLFITREIVGRLGGTITVQSRPGEGATFTVLLPVEADAESREDLARPDSTAGAR